MLHYRRRALGAEPAFIHRMVGITLHMADAAVHQMDPDAAATGTHETMGVSHLIRDGGRQVEIFLPRIEIPARH